VNDFIHIPAEDCIGTYLSDQDVAKILRLSPAWVRKQRYLRSGGESHVLSIDPVYIGSSPRYRLADFNKWLVSLND
jgi:hypothetical protein